MEKEGVVGGVAESELEGRLSRGGIAFGVLDEGKVSEKAGMSIEMVFFEKSEAGLFLELAGEADPKGWKENGS